MNLKISNLSKTYSNGVRALNNIDLTVSTGMFGLLGPNGAGKSTLMRTIATLQGVDKGTIFLDEIDVLSDKMKIRQILGYLPQEFGVYPEMSAEGMLNQIALLKGIGDKKERRITVQNILHKTNLYEYRKRKLGGFSGGMKQRFGIAQALLGNPQLIIVDEPTAGLDPEERNRFHNILSEISEERIVILSTHIVDDVRVLCNQVAIIHLGEVLLFGETDEAIQALQGKIWQKIICKDELEDHVKKYQVVMNRLQGGKVVIHIFSDQQPAGFEKVQPDLEDVYFKTIRE